MTTSKATYDPVAMSKRLQGDEQHVRDLVELFLQYGPKMLGDIQEAVAKQDPGAIEFSAHRAKGALASIHAEPARELTQRLEQVATEGDTSAALLLMPDLAEAWAALVQDLSSAEPSSSR